MRARGPSSTSSDDMHALAPIGPVARACSRSGALVGAGQRCCWWMWEGRGRQVSPKRGDARLLVVSSLGSVYVAAAATTTTCCRYSPGHYEHGAPRISSPG